ncbi:hypothetical protein M8C21_001556 [Ambrosia artemisiifolia]|uniref:Transmembrane protein n=1 Tax=Ambrosia artemisiifolia TaxID=4212 RepID=A0AAD5CJ46_AMBAR|nr:hypothetical protein M8C21_001556 [Ambrosia artemisiifolia]
MVVSTIYIPNPKAPKIGHLLIPKTSSSPFFVAQSTKTKYNMGGGEHHGEHGGDFRTKVWTMTGGPNCRPLHWKRNTAIAMAGIFLVCIPIAMKSAELEQRPHMPVRPVPSQIWCKNFGNKEY